MVKDYRIPGDIVRVVPNCIDVEHFSQFATPEANGVIAVGRLAVRKGWEQVVALSHECDVSIEVVGAPSLWSDYRSLLSRGAPSLHVAGHCGRDEVARRVARSTGLLQLSRYEPFGLTVAESLAVGRPVVVTDAVGAAEDIDARCKFVVTIATEGAGDDLVSAVSALTKLSGAERQALAEHCQQEAHRLFRPEIVADQWLRAVSSLLNE
jgi:glycosyltransferase involved in cell wall biosynthesis